MPVRSLPVLDQAVDRVEGAVCRPSGLDVPLTREGATELARLFKALADPARLQLLSLITASADGECCVCDLTASLGLSQPTVSHHLKILTDAGIVTRQRRGTWAWYSIVPESLTALGEVLA